MQWQMNAVIFQETSQATGTSYTNRHANRMICQDEKTGLEGSLVSTGPVKLQLDTLHVSDLRLSIASSIIGNPESSILAKCLPTSDNDKESSCQSHRMAKTLPVAGSVPCVFPMLPSTSLDEIEFAAATGDSSTVARELTAGAQALSNEERSALRSQVPNIRECCTHVVVWHELILLFPLEARSAAGNLKVRSESWYI